MDTDRLEAFSDGVIAIAITLIVLDTKLPRAGHSLGHELLNVISQIRSNTLGLPALACVFTTRLRQLLCINRNVQRTVLRRFRLPVEFLAAKQLCK